jgi:uncharacterized protein YqhQ
VAPEREPSEVSDEPRYMGGQAVLEGVMMRGPQHWAVSVRLPDGSIATKVEPVANWSEKYRRIPLVRGVASLGESLTLGYRALHWSANQQLASELAAEEAELAAIDPSAMGDVDRAKLEKRIARTRKQSSTLSEGAVGGTMIVALVVFAGLFLVLPALVGKGIHGWIDVVPFQVGEGVVRLGFFIGYVALISLMKDIRRVFEFHGAEHKAIAAYENGVELTPEVANQFTTAHVRCGTNFLLTVMVIAIVCYSFVPTPNLWWLVASRVILIPVIAGISYELIRNAAKRMHLRWVRAAMKPGLLLQKLTTREPALDQLEVAIASLRACMTAEQLTEVERRAGIRTPAVRPAFGIA